MVPRFKLRFEGCFWLSVRAPRSAILAAWNGLIRRSVTAMRRSARPASTNLAMVSRVSWLNFGCAALISGPGLGGVGPGLGANVGPLPVAFMIAQARFHAWFSQPFLPTGGRLIRPASSAA